MKKKLGLLMAMVLAAMNCVSASASTIYKESNTYFGDCVFGVYDKYESSYNEIIGSGDDEIYDVDSFMAEGSVFGKLTDIKEKVNRISKFGK